MIDLSKPYWIEEAKRAKEKAKEKDDKITCICLAIASFVLLIVPFVDCWLRLK